MGLQLRAEGLVRRKLWRSLALEAELPLQAAGGNDAEWAPDVRAGGAVVPQLLAEVAVPLRADLVHADDCEQVKFVLVGGAEEQPVARPDPAHLMADAV